MISVRTGAYRRRCVVSQRPVKVILIVGHLIPGAQVTAVKVTVESLVGHCVVVTFIE